jgi:hypothetical protein
MTPERSSNTAGTRPSITAWTRLEPLPREASLTHSLQGQIRDPLWMLARQWQVGEFLGADAGAPVQATFAGETRTVTTFCPGTDSRATQPIDPKLPLEVHVEREDAVLRLRGSVQLGFYFESLVRQSGIASPETVIAAFRQAFPIAATAPDPTLAPVEALRFRALMAGRVTDGEALYASATAMAAGQSPATPVPNFPGLTPVLATFVAYRASLFSEPAPHDSSWQDSGLAFAFSLGSPTPTQNLILNAPEFPGGHLDWNSFSLQNGSPNPVASAHPAQVTPVSFNFFPNQVTFRGAHDPRWWTFEDSVTDFGQLDAEHVDLAKLLVMEFALVYGNDWFSVPVPAPIGSLSRVTTLVVTDTFGVRTLIRPSEQTVVNPGEKPWSMYKLSGNGTRSDYLFLAPTLGVVENADDLEHVRFLRDDMAAMAWAVEHQLQGDLDAPVDAHEAYLQRIQANGLSAAPASGSSLYYTVEIPPPDNWIPMVPVRTPQGALYLRRGTLEILTAHGPIYVPPRALILHPGQPFFLADHVVPRSGIQAERYFRRTRAMDGTTYLWLSRKSGPGTGMGWSGLRFDVVQT